MKIYKDLLNEGEDYELNHRWEQAFNLYINAEKIVKKYGSKIEIGNIYYRKGRVLAQKGNLKESLNAFKESLKFLKKGEGMPLQIATVTGAIGDAYKINGTTGEALKAYQEALKILKAEKERVVYTHSHLINQILEAMAKQLNNIGEIYLLLKYWDKALENCRESLKVALDLKISSIILTSRLAISKIYSEKGDSKSALEYLMKSIDIAKKEKDEFNLLKIFLEIANIYNIEKNTKFSLNYYRKALKLSEKLKNKQKLTEILDKIGTVYLEKNNRKKAIEFLQKSYEIGNEIKQYYFEYILYHLGVLYYLNKDYDSAYKNLKESLKFAERTNDIKLLRSVSIKIGDLLKLKDSYDDSIYYYKKALEHTRNLETQVKILNKIGLSNLLYNNLHDANDYFLRAFNWLRVLLLAELNFVKKRQLLKEFSDIPQNMCAIKCVLYEKTKNIELLKEAVGYSEFIRSQKRPADLKSDFKRKDSLERKKIQIQMDKKCLELKELNGQYQLEKNIKAKEKLLAQIDETQRILFLLDDSIWETSTGAIESFPHPVEKIFGKLFSVFRNISDSWAILDFVYVKALNKLYIFFINMKSKELYLFSKQFNERFTNSVQNKLKQLEDPKVKENHLKFEKVLVSLNNLGGKIVTTPLTNFLTKSDIITLTIVPHSFLWKLSWETMLIKKRQLNQLFKLQRIFSLNYLILQKTAEKN